MLKPKSLLEMSNILRFNIMAASGCAAYYLWSKYSNRKALQAEYCTEALQLVRDYPQIEQILGKQIKLTKLIQRRDANPFTDLSQAKGAGPGRQIRVKCELTGRKADGLLYVYASSKDASAPDKLSSAATSDTFSNSILSQQPTSQPQSGWAIDRLDLQLTSKNTPPALRQKWTLYESLATHRDRNQKVATAES